MKNQKTAQIHFWLHLHDFYSSQPVKQFKLIFKLHQLTTGQNLLRKVEITCITSKYFFCFTTTIVISAMSSFSLSLIFLKRGKLI